MGSVTKRMQVTSVNGEVTINLQISLDINLNNDGTISVAAKGQQVEAKEKVDWIVPQFTTDKLLDFGNEVK